MSGETCDWDSDGDPQTGSDTCVAGAFCSLIIDSNGNPTGSSVCTSNCNSSETGQVGEFCASNQACSLAIPGSANLAVCQQSLSTAGVLLGGEVCNSDDECRSGLCDRLSSGGPGGSQKYCIDHCGSDTYCTATDTNCRLRRTAAEIDTVCWNVALPTGITGVGSTCSIDSDCDHGLCATVNGANVCTEACVRDSDCLIGFTCSLQGDAVATNLLLPDPASMTVCSSDSDCEAGLQCLTTSSQCAFT